MGRAGMTPAPTSETDRCEACGKPRAICVCDRVVPLETRVRVLVLRHPQEGDVDLGTVPLLSASLPRCTVRTGLSWPSLERALGDDAIDRARWAVVFPGKLSAGAAAQLEKARVLALDRKGEPRDPAALDGIVVLDGTWSQAKTLWWRNPWLLKLGRLALLPREPSMYGRMRREPRREHVSTLEAVADVLVALGESEDVRAQLRRLMRTMLQRARDASKDAGEAREER
jgi:DTW domain-containing protein YfiP